MRGDPREEIPNLITEGRGKRLLITAGIAVAVVGAAIVAFVVIGGQKKSAQQKRAGQAFAAFERCLLGDPLGEGETASKRQRAIQLGRYHTAVASDDQRKSPWPKRCLPYAQELYDALAKAGAGAESASGRLMRGTYGAMSVLKDGKTVPTIDEIWAAAKETGLPRAQAKNVLPPPTAVRPILSKAGTPSIGNNAQLGWIAPNSRRLHVVIGRDVGGDGDTESLVCSLGDKNIPAPPITKARCRRLPQSTKDGVVRTLETDDDQVSLLYLEGDGGGIMNVDGQIVWPYGDRVVLGGHARGAHFASLVQLPKTGFALVHGSAGSVVETPLTSVPADTHVVVQAGEWLLWVTKGPDTRPHLFAHRITHADPPLGALIDVGAFGEAGASGAFTRACATPERTLITTESNYEVFLTSLASETPAPLVKIDEDSGASAITSCFGEALIVASSRSSVTEHRCTAQGCAKVTAEAGLLFSARVVSAQDRVLALWSSDDPMEDGTVWMRLSPIGELTSTSDTMLFDGVDGAGLSAIARGLYSWNGLGLALVFDAQDEATYLLRIDPAGAVTPIALDIQ